MWPSQPVQSLPQNEPSPEIEPTPEEQYAALKEEFRRHQQSEGNQTESENTDAHKKARTHDLVQRWVSTEHGGYQPWS
ncbi:MAG TPA: hypothetical protein VK970_22325 [Candidatus Methylacidiphilales bacterium]|nr:hypothetical protein [Candidatus Methylacidiphilales bacterium]